VCVCDVYLFLLMLNYLLIIVIRYMVTDILYFTSQKIQI